MSYKPDGLESGLKRYSSFIMDSFASGGLPSPFDPLKLKKTSPDSYVAGLGGEEVLFKFDISSFSDPRGILSDHPYFGVFKVSYKEEFTGIEIIFGDHETDETNDCHGSMYISVDGKVLTPGGEFVRFNIYKPDTFKRFTKYFNEYLWKFLSLSDCER
ncbi:MAG TPA: hypothetical protein VLJ60_07820 [bacterium]|nr:hypothetical protein [bacterium]